LFGRRLERKAGQQFHQPSPQPRSRDRVTRQHVSKDQSKGSSATAAPSSMGTKHPLPPQRPAVAAGRIVAEATTVTVQSADAAAMRTGRLLERKSRVVNPRGSRTK
jgi:hypothetical protein